MGFESRCLAPSGPQRAVLAAVLVVVLLSAGACGDRGPRPQEQREVVLRTVQTLIDLTGESMSTSAVEVTDDGTTLRACPEGGSRYIYAAVLGPADWDGYADGATRALESTFNATLGWMLALNTEPEYEFAPRFDDQTSSVPTDPREPLSASFVATNGADEGISLTAIVRLTDDDEVYAELSAQTRCG